jgi:starvation-inducible DNA-binding protein
VKPVNGTCDELGVNAKGEIGEALTVVDMFALYVKTKNFHWYAPGLGSRSRHLLLAEQAGQVLVTIDTIGECVRALGGTAIESIGELGRLHRISDSASADLTTREMLAALLRDTRRIAKQMRRTYGCAERMAISPAQARWRIGSTRPRAGTGSSLRYTTTIEARHGACGGQRGRGCPPARGIEAQL